MYLSTLVLKEMQAWPMKWEIRILSSLERGREHSQKEVSDSVKCVREFRKFRTEKCHLISTKKLVTSVKAVLAGLQGAFEIQTAEGWR